MTLISCPLKLLPLATFVVAITALWVGLDIFSLKASMRHEIRLFPKSGILLRDIETFYADNGFELPASIKSNGLKEDADDKYLSHHQTIWKYLSSPGDSEGALSLIRVSGIPDLEGKLRSSEPSRGAGIRVGGLRIPEDKIPKWLEVMRAKIPDDKAYYVFLRAAHYSHIYDHMIILENVGALPLRALQVSIYPPFDDVPPEYRSIFKDYFVTSTHWASVNFDPGRVEISIPRLEIGEKFVFNLSSRSYPIQQQDIVYTFAPVREVSKARALQFAGVVAAVLFGMICLIYLKCDPQ